MDPNSPSTIYTRSYRLWRTTDRGDSWNPLPTTTIDGSTWQSSAGITYVAVAPSNSSILMAIHITSGIFRSTDGGITWASATFKIPFWIGRLEIDPLNPEVVYAPYSEPFTGTHLFMTTNGGKSWIQRDAGLPNFTARAVRVDPTNSNILYCGTDIGVYQSTDQGATWQRFGVGLPNVQVNALQVFEDGSALRAATFGRGIWEIQLRPPIIPRPIISSASTKGKKLYVYGKNFDNGAVILIKSERQKTQNDADSPRATLVAKKSGKKVRSGDKLQVRTSSGITSEEFMFIQ